jgi:hypothetical protein
MSISSFIAVGNTQVIVANTVQQNVLFSDINTNVFRIVTNTAATSATTFVGVFAGNTATSFNHPGLTIGAGQGFPVTNAEPTYVAGNFGKGGITGNVTVATITSSGASLVYITPVVIQGPGIA